MRTLPVGVVHGLLRWVVRPIMGPPLPARVQRVLLDVLATASVLPTGVTVRRAVLAGRPCEQLVPTDANPTRAVLLLHGGAFQVCSPRTHRVFAAHLAQAAGCTVHVLDYRLAPEHPYPAAVDDAIAAYDALAGHARISVVGDSAGGTLALLLARTRRPAALALVSPLVDLTRRTSSAWTGKDVLVREDWARQGTAAFLGSADAEVLSPLRDDLSGLPPLLVHVSEHERLRPEGELLAERARDAGVDVQLVVLQGLWHDVHVQAGMLAEAAEAVAAMGRWVAVRGKTNG